MSHILVKWVEDEKWDVYPVSALADADVAFRLISQQGCIKQLRGTVHRVSWKEGAPPALAELLAFGEYISCFLTAVPTKGLFDSLRAHTTKFCALPRMSV